MENKENKIRLLPEIVANQIAAGEVVDNPASAIKEMMENSIDAGATSITVNFRNAGLELIQIVDNGCGMSPMDARMAFDRHATSKIETFDDVYRLQTFGFRGEALASIAAVAQVELRTRQQGDEIGTTTIINGGEFISQTPTMCPAGSQFMVRNLFYTAPARRKFNSNRTKMVNEIKRVFRQVALCNPQVRCELMSNDMPIITLEAGSLMERIIGVVGRHIKSNLLEVDVDTTIVRVRGYVGRPAAAKQKNTEQYLFVNGRFFRSPQLYRSIMKAYEKLIPDSDSPSYFLYLTLDPERVDVNVSPHKTEVHFADTEDVNQIVTAAVRSTLAKSGSVAMMDFENKVAIDIPVLGSNSAIYAEPRSTSRGDYNPFNEDYIDTSLAETQPERAFDDPFELSAARPTFSGAKPSAGAKVDSLRDVGWSEIMSGSDFSLSVAPQGSFTDITLPSAEPSEQYQDIPSAFSSLDEATKTPPKWDYPSEAMQSQIEYHDTMSFQTVMPLAGGYAVAMSGGRVMIVDLRRAKERLLYDGFVAMLGAGSLASQKLLFAERLLLSEEDYHLLSEHEVEFAALGFDLLLKGEGEVEVCGIPSCTTAEQADSLLYDLLREVEMDGNVGERVRSDMARVMAQKCSRLPQKGVSVEEAQDILQRLCECENYSFSPSGKSIMAELTAEELKLKLS